MIASVAQGLSASWLLARGRAEALELFDSGDAAQRAAVAARSFWAAALCLPAFVCLDLLGWLSGGAPRHAGHALAADLLTWVIGWVGFALLSHQIAGLAGRQDRWWRFIAAWNWCNVAQYLLTVASALPAAFGAPAMVGEAASLVAIGWALWIEWFATRLALDLPGAGAAGLVALDFGLGLLLTAISTSLLPP